MSPILLQIAIQIPRQNPVAVIIVIAVIVAAVLFFVVAARAGGGTAGAGAGTPQKFSRGRFRRISRSFGLNPVQTKTLENLVLRYRASAPYAVFTSQQQLDVLLKKSIADIRQQSQTEAVKEAHINTLYRIKQSLERNSLRNRNVGSTNQLRAGQTISITDQNGTRYPSKITARLKDLFAAETPLDDSGNQVRWQKWTPVQVFVPRGGGKGVSFTTKVTGYNVVKGVNSVLLQHTQEVSQAAQRKYRRKNLDRPAYFYGIQIMTVGTGRDARKQAVPQTKGSLGTIQDVSAGGCALKSTFPLPRGSLVKVEFETERKRQIAVYGKVKNVRKAEPMGGVMHIQFTRISQKSLNTINAYVYEL